LQQCEFFLYLFCHDFRKIICGIKIFDKCTSDDVARVTLLPPSPRRLESLPPRATAAGEPPTVGSTGRWGQYLMPRPTASGKPSTKGHDVMKLSSWAAASAAAYIKGRAPAASPSSLTTPLKSSALSTSSECL
jgi:hypothetical protein